MDLCDDACPDQCALADRGRGNGCREYGREDLMRCHCGRGVRKMC